MTGGPATPRRIGDTPQGGPVQAFYLRKGTERRPPIARGEGIYLWDATRRRYLDASSGPVVSNLGHGNPRVLAAMHAQAAQVTFAYPGLFESEANTALADLICTLAGPGLDRAFFVSGGSEATEAAIKLARQYALAIGQPERVTVIGLEPGYHGATLGALAVTGEQLQVVRDEGCGPTLAASMPRRPNSVPAGRMNFLTGTGLKHASVRRRRGECRRDAEGRHSAGDRHLGNHTRRSAFRPFLRAGIIASTHQTSPRTDL